MSNLLVNGNALSIPLEDESVHCCITSPPYYGLRNYSTGDQKDNELGTEKSHDCLGWATGEYCNECYVCRTLQWTNEVKRVLRNDGTFWLNISDSYSGSGGSGGDYNKGGLREGQPKYRNTNHSLPAKNLYGIPWRVALALQANGWTLRSDIIWYSPNKMPESITDRPSKGHEYIFLLTKSKRYFFDAHAIREPQIGNIKAPKSYRNPDPSGTDGSTLDGRVAGSPQDGLKNRKTVWTIPTKGVGGSHFAKFPSDLPELAIKAGTSEHGCCSKCGAPYKRIVDRKFTGEYNDKEALKQRKRMEGVISGGKDKVTLGRTESVSKSTIGWEPTCDCCQICDRYNTLHDGEPCKPYPVEPCIVLDPFVGSGTTLLAARKLGRNGIGIDLSLHYLQKDCKNRLGIAKKEEWLEKAEVRTEEETEKKPGSIF